MTLSSTRTKIHYNGDGVQTDFPVPFLFLEETHLAVTMLNRDTLVETIQLLNGDYTVSGVNDPNGGTVHMVVAPEGFERLTIIRDVPYNQLIDLQENENFPANTIEFALDKLTMLLQQADETIRRGILLKVTSDGPAVFPPGGLSDVLIFEVKEELVDDFFRVVEQRPVAGGGWEDKPDGIESSTATVLPHCVDGWEDDIPVIVVGYAYVDDEGETSYHFEAPQPCSVLV